MALGAWTFVNAFRHPLGLLPKFLVLPHGEMCQKHVECWRRNGFTGHDEDASKPGFGEEGEEAGHSSTAWPGRGAADVPSPASSPTSRA